MMISTGTFLLILLAATVAIMATVNAEDDNDVLVLSHEMRAPRTRLMIGGIVGNHQGSSNDVKDEESVVLSDEDFYRIANGEKCEDDASYTFELPSGYIRDCAFIAANKREKMYHCKNKYDNRGKVKKFCPLTCGLCEPSCKDNTKFVFKKGKGYTCEDLFITVSKKTRDKFCGWEEVIENCPKGCEKCCGNNDNFVSKKDDMTCMDVLAEPKKSRKLLCARVDILRNCQQVCEACTNDTNPTVPSLKPSKEPTKEPIKVPTPTANPSHEPSRPCDDSDSFTFRTYNNGRKDCDWVAAKEKRQEKWCDTRGSDGRADKKVKYYCQDACSSIFSKCKSNSSLPTSKPWSEPSVARPSTEPSTVPSLQPSTKEPIKVPAPTTNPSREPSRTCKDKPDFSFETTHAGRQDCDWVAAKEERQEEWCNDNYYVNALIKFLCAEACSDYRDDC